MGEYNCTGRSCAGRIWRVYWRMAESQHLTVASELRLDSVVSGRSNGESSSVHGGNGLVTGTGHTGQWLDREPVSQYSTLWLCKPFLPLLGWKTSREVSQKVVDKSLTEGGGTERWCISPAAGDSPLCREKPGVLAGTLWESCTGRGTGRTAKFMVALYRGSCVGGGGGFSEQALKLKICLGRELRREQVYTGKC